MFSFLRLFYDQVNNIILPYGHVKCNSKGKDKPILEESGGTREYSETLLHFFLERERKFLKSKDMIQSVTRLRISFLQKRTMLLDTTTATANTEKSN